MSGSFMDKIKRGQIHKNDIRAYHVMQRIVIYNLSKKKEDGANGWIIVTYAGEKVQVDVKYVIRKRLAHNPLKSTINK